MLVIASAGLSLAAPAGADTTPAPPFIDHVTWTNWGDLKSLRVYPTPAGRQAAAQLLKPPSEIDEAWGEVLALAPDADLPGMRDQFVCHFRFAEFGQPGKTSWNLEPFRPVVDDQTMTQAGCNPGGLDEPF
ncbi:DUF2599 domain-containing protein [Mycolicibacterium sphagni]|uniref:DUF2599 domain-containing protein n=1 Tax=Mycolicibacterium sphagni TaxID=1786 RepID=A0ABX2JYL7_9MYCO|nr:DUF2599 domain-containing protein [Mycolicibacterium sphagni]NTY62485.1 DUF2599 domain-containing protein [Mycolicibacterium sphagni]